MNGANRHVQGEGWTGIDSFAAAAITIVAGTVRLARLRDPSGIIFDETYYAKDACWYVNVSSSVCGTSGEQTLVHPPLGKWLIAIGIRLFGYNSLGWRISAAVAGAITVALLYLLARKILASTVGASLSAGLLALDPLHFVQSRVAMLDIFVPLFGVAAFLFLAYDRDRILARPTLGPRDAAGKDGLLERPWRLAAGAAAGAAMASKWSGALVLAAVIVVSFAWELSARRGDGRGRPLLRTLRQEGVSFVAWLMVVPLAVYLFTWLGRLQGKFLAAPWAQGSWLRAVWDNHVYMYNFHSDLSATHSYQSPPWSWPLLKRPVSYAYCDALETPCSPPAPEGHVAEVFATGNPFVWWASILALLFVAGMWILKLVRRDDRPGPEGLILAGFGFTYLPWLLPFLSRSAVFIFYLLPAVPFMCLALGYVATRIGDSWEGRGATALFAAGAIGTFIFYYPLLANVQLPREDWEKRIWIFDDCDKPPGKPTTSTITETTKGRVETSTTVTTSDADLPPTGWCWI